MDHPEVTSLAAAFPRWEGYNTRLRAAVASLSAEQLGATGGGAHWPLWAVVGHLCCQRVFWLCDVAVEPGAERTPFPEAGTNCPGDDDLEHVMRAADLEIALSSTYQIVLDRLQTWTLSDLAVTIRHPEWGDDWTHTRGEILSRVFAHDISHIVEVNELLASIGHEPISLWG